MQGNAWRSRRFGLLYALLASLFVSISSALVKSSRTPIGQTSFITSLIIFLASLLIAAVRCEDVFPRGYRVHLALASLLSGFVLVSDYEAMRLMPLGDEVVISYTSVIFTILLARLFLKEPCGTGKLICALLIVTGVAFISRWGRASEGSSYPNYNFGFFLTIIGAFFDGATYIFIKGLSELHYSVMLTNCGLFSMVLTGPMELLESWSVPSEPVILFTIATLTLLQEVFLYMAMKTGEEAGLVSLVQALDIVFSYIWEVSFFDEPHTALPMIGAGLVCGGIVLAAFTSEGPNTESEGYLKLKPEEEIQLFTSDSPDKIFKMTHTSIATLELHKPLVEVFHGRN